MGNANKTRIKQREREWDASAAPAQERLLTKPVLHACARLLPVKCQRNKSSQPFCWLFCRLFCQRSKSSQPFAGYFAGYLPAKFKQPAGASVSMDSIDILITTKTFSIEQLVPQLQGFACTRKYFVCKIGLCYVGTRTPSHKTSPAFLRQPFAGYFPGLLPTK